METDAHYTIIGALTIAVIMGIFGFILWLSGGEQQTNRKVYSVIFASSVSGLATGSYVTFNGLRVGEVKSLDLGDDPNRVVAVITVSERTPVKVDTRARLEYQGLTGIASVALSGGGLESKPLNGISKENPETIYADRSDYQNIVDSLQSLTQKATNAFDRVNNFLDTNQNNVSKTIGHIEQFSHSLSLNAGETDQIFKNTKELTAELATTSKKLNEMLAQPNTKNMLEHIADAAASLKKLSDNLDKRTKDLSSSLSVDSRRTLDQINRTATSIQKNPQQIIFGPKNAVPEYEPH